MTDSTHTSLRQRDKKPTNKLARHARLKKGMNPEWVHERPFLAQPSLQSDERKLAQAPHIHTGNATARYTLREKPLDHRDAHEFHAKTPPDELFSPLLGQIGRSGAWLSSTHPRYQKRRGLERIDALPKRRWRGRKTTHSRFGQLLRAPGRRIRVPSRYRCF
jgi:hypothetical protein